MSSKPEYTVDQIEYWDQFCRRSVGMTLDLFTVRYEAGEFDGLEEGDFYDAVQHMAFALPFINGLRLPDDPR